jgi:hypothetical protein
MGLEHELRSVSDEMLSTLDQLARLEGEKRVEQPGTPRFVSLANEIEKLAALVFAQTNTQHTLAQISQKAVTNGADLPAIDETAATRDVSVILAEWREAERVLATSAIETAEHAKAVADVRRLRSEYHRAYSANAKGGSTES